MNNNLEEFLDDVMHALPHGSGINFDWSIEKFRPLNATQGIVWFENGWDYMNEVGMYDGSFGFTVSFEYDMEKRTAKYRRVWAAVSEWLVKGECGLCDGKHEWDCPICKGIGRIWDGESWCECDECNLIGTLTCSECDEEGLVEYDDLPALMDNIDQTFREEIKLDD